LVQRGACGFQKAGIARGVAPEAEAMPGAGLHGEGDISHRRVVLEQLGDLEAAR
jgi:hypothetical protein